MNWLMDRIPGINKIKLTPKTIQKRMGIFGDSGVMGLLIGIVIGILAKYSVTKTLQLGVSTAAVLVLMPRMVSLLMEGLTPISEGANELVQKHFPGRNLYIGMDSALAVGNETVLSASLLLVPITLLIAVILPGNHVLPFGNLATIPYMIAIMAACRIPRRHFPDAGWWDRGHHLEPVHRFLGCSTGYGFRKSCQLQPSR